MSSSNLISGAGEVSLPIKPIPGSYGVPFFSPIKDRLDFFYFQGHHAFFQSRIAKHGGATVFRVNMPPGPFIASDPRAICVLDAKSFTVLFDTDKVDKRDVVVGTFNPSTSLTGGHRVCVYLDPSEPDHATIKNVIFNLLAARKSHLIPTFRAAYAKLFEKMIFSKRSNFNDLNDVSAFEFVNDFFFGVRPSGTALGQTGPAKAAKWLLVMLHPLLAVGKLPSVIEDLLLHTFRLPSCLVKSDYKELYSYYNSAASSYLENDAMSKDEVCHNLLYTAIFNAYGGIKVFFTTLLARVAQAGPTLHKKLAHEIRSVVKADGGEVTFLGLMEKMELTKSVVYEALRIDPPVELQWGRAKRDLVVESHDAAYEVKKGELIVGFQPMATRDERVFVNGGEFVADRFVGEKGEGLLKYVVWSNGPETGRSGVGNKQCAGKEVVPIIGRLLLVELFLRFDTFTADVVKSVRDTQVTITSFTEATTTASAE